jgi:acyl-CoA thioesterase-1
MRHPNARRFLSGFGAAAVLIAAMSIAAWLGAVAPAVAAPVEIAAFGDSATAGWLVPRRQSYPAQLQAALRAKGYDVIVKNAGRAGDTARAALRRFDDAIDPGTAICVLEFGTNDRRQGASAKVVEARIATLIRALRARRIAVLVIGLGQLDLGPVARANHVAYAQWRLPPGQYRARDGAHYNAAGYKIVVGRMLPQIEALLAAVQN